MNTSPAHRLKIGSLLFLLLVGCKTKSPDEGRDAGDAGDLDANDLDESLDTITPVTDSTDASPRTVLADVGTGCAVNAECASGSCVDGVCCTSSMCGACQSCGLADSMGVCAPLPPLAEDPGSGCTVANACDGAGHCLTSNGRSCASDGACASGHCTDGVCCASRCDAQCFSCALAGSAGTCEPLNGVQDLSASALCAGPFLCVATASGAPACRARDGASCASDLDCASGHCRTYYLDGDGDGYGASLHTLVRCDANVNPPSGYVAIGGDCCDFDKAANPAVPKTGYFTTPDACGDFDYDCDGLLEKQHTTGSCVGLSSGVTPDCGKACESGFGIHLTSLYTQACR